MAKTLGNLGENSHKSGDDGLATYHRCSLIVISNPIFMLNVADESLFCDSHALANLFWDYSRDKITCMANQLDSGKLYCRQTRVRTMEEVTMEDAVSVKLEQDLVNQQILLFYVDEGGGNEQSIITTVQDIQQAVPIDPAQNYYIGETPMDAESDNNYIVMDAASIIVDNAVYANLQDIWSETEDKRLLVFYIDNKETFLEGVTKETFLWSVACKTMLMGKTPEACKLKLESLRIKYKEILQKHSLHVTTENDVQWPYFVLAHQAFHNEVGDPNSDNENLTDPTNSLASTLYDVGNSNILRDESVETNQMRVRECNEGNERLIIKRPGFNEQIFRTKSNNADASVLNMLDLYLQLQSVDNMDTKTKWEVIANKMGENNREYWHKRFLNYRQHYIMLLEKHGSDQSNITWPYMEIFNELFKDDENFQQKYNFKDNSAENDTETNERTEVIKPTTTALEHTWSTPEMVILVKHYFDYYDEHQDPTLPKQFLWSEIGRLLDKDPDKCKSQYEELRANHLDKYIKGGYKTSNRDPLSILYDHIISMDVKNQMLKIQLSTKNTRKIYNNNSDMVIFFYENMELFKDEMCYYVCWAAVALKLKTSLKNCLLNWYALKAVYKSNLNQRKNLEILGSTWVYMDVFDEIFNFGNDEKMLLGYEKLIESNIDDESENTGTDTENFNLDENTKTTKLLKYYAEHKEKFDKSPKVTTLWRDLAQEIGLTNKECASELNIIKTKYLDILETGLDDSAKTSLWKYYEACNKIFGPDLKLHRKQQKYNESDSKPKFRNADVDVEYTSIGSAEQKNRKATIKKVTRIKGPVKIIKWTEKSREQLLMLYLRQLKTNRYRTIDSHKMWKELSLKLNKPPEQCKKMFVKLKKLNQSATDTSKYKGLIDEILSIKCTFHNPLIVNKKRVDYKNVELPKDVLKTALEYYFKNLEEFVSGIYSQTYSWRQLSKMVDESVYKLYQKINYLKTNYDKLQDSSFAIILNLILEKESEILKSDVKVTVRRGRSKIWSDDERNKLKELYCSSKEKFANPKYLKKYLWHEIGLVLNRSYKECRKEFLLLQSADDKGPV